MRLRNKTALVTGAAGGIGSATAVCFAREGAFVVLSDIREEGCLQVLDTIRVAGGDGAVIPAEMTSEKDIVSLFQQTASLKGRLDILAAIAGGDVEPAALPETIDGDKLSLNLDLNLKSCMLCCREAVKIMKPQQYGRIVTMSSLVYRGSPNQFSYAASKGGIHAFSRSLAMALGSYNITVNALAPALVEVPAFIQALGRERWEALKRDCAMRYPLQRIAQPGDVALCALFLASDDASFITGQILEISGGARL
ncbi:SDR family NAD(P)-dependent oxidoreductase [Chlorobium phaeobacteroides]|uniref:Short-chain dehydrogenase/reductase SDR n=1 Tax=Chlorobium phaeobacteroides (strain DSM 266 / SMG 266 / 2430) TaxID=290317 RepID=A1BFC0_CHLPD|nr:SDR family NAD(P)-dependent oxidoreductase [Chlorobium phaeobacteroides]ABL65097.1 short-chain dehydrogenase/reductase SDR [Chlorobium phaeobacteroides DSM 266]